MNETTSSLYSRQIDTTYKYLKALDSSKNPPLIYVNEDLSLGNTFDIPSDRGIKTVRKILQEEQLEQKTRKKAKFIEAVLQHMTDGVDSDLSILCTLNLFRSRLRQLDTIQRKQWKDITHAICEEYLFATKENALALKQAIEINTVLLKATLKIDEPILNDLPDEVWVNIFSKVLSVRDLKTLEIVCKRFLVLANDPFVQTQFMKREFKYIPSSATCDTLKRHFMLCKSIQTNTLEEVHVRWESIGVQEEKVDFLKPDKISTYYSKTLLSSKRHKFLYIYDVKNLQEPRRLQTRYIACTLYKESIFLLFDNSKIQQLNVTTLLPEGQFEFKKMHTYDGRKWKDISIDDTYIYIKSDHSIGIIDRAKESPFDEIPFNTTLPEHLVSNDWIIGYSHDAVVLEYPKHKLLEELASCTPHSIQGTYLFCLTQNLEEIKIFDLNTCTTIGIITIQELSPSFKNFPSNVKITESNNIVYIACGCVLYIWDLLKQNLIKELFTSSTNDQIQVFDHLLFLLDSKGMNYIDLMQKNIPPQNSISLIMSTFEHFKKNFLSCF